MTDREPLATRCPSCGTEVTGNFCSNCGSGRGGAICPACQKTSPAGTRFCSHCGSSMTGGPPVPAGADPIRKYAPWVLGGGLAIALIALMVRQPSIPTAAPSGADQAPAAGGGGEAPPDISSMSPRERFNRLYSRIITAAQTGDQATVERFTPMAISAYGMLDKVDADARYHLAMIQLHIGDLAGAQAQADSLVKGEPDHLFGYVIDAAVARWNKNEAKRQAAYQKFLSRYDIEMKSNKPEYTEHGSMLAEVFKAAKGGGGA